MYVPSTSLSPLFNTDTGFCLSFLRKLYVEDSVQLTAYQNNYAIIKLFKEKSITD